MLPRAIQTPLSFLFVLPLRGSGRAEVVVEVAVRSPVEVEVVAEDVLCSGRSLRCYGRLGKGLWLIMAFHQRFDPHLALDIGVRLAHCGCHERDGKST